MAVTLLFTCLQSVTWQDQSIKTTGIFVLMIHKMFQFCLYKATGRRVYSWWLSYNAWCIRNITINSINVFNEVLSEATAKLNGPQKCSRVSNVIYNRKEKCKCSSLQMFLFSISNPKDLTRWDHPSVLGWQRL